MDQEKKDSYLCKFCGFCCSTEDELGSHISARHKEFKCSICHKKFINLEEIRCHIRGAHLVNLTCQICDKSFANEVQYKNHCKSHLNIECEEIHSDISTEESRKAVPQESGERLSGVLTDKSQEFLKCTFCNFVTVDNDILNAHIVSHVTIEILQCSECGAYFDDKIKLRKHKIVHKKIYYQCGVCLYKSQSKKCIIKHVSVKHIRQSQGYRYCNSTYFG